MAVITLRIDDDTKEEVEAFAAEAGITVSELLRRGLDTIINRSFADATDPGSGTRYQLGTVDRAVLLRLEDILSRLEEDDHERDRHRTAMAILEHGFTADYSEVLYGLDRQLTEPQCRLVWDILDLYRAIRASLARFDDTTRAQFSPYETDFPGFDVQAPDESPLLGYARHLIADGRWSDLADRFDASNDHGNSHSPRLANYKAMVTRWHQIQREKRNISSGGALDAYLLSAVELESVLDSGRLGKHARR